MIMKPIMKPKYVLVDIYGLWYLTLMLTIGIVKGKDGCRDMKYLDCIQNKTLTGHVIKSSRVIVPGLQICQNNCYHEDQCVSYNLGPVEGHSRTCELSAADHWTRPGFLVPKEGFEYCPIENPCSSNPCNKDRLCTPDFAWDTHSCDDGGWTQWDSWTSCTSNCPRVRSRSCKSPAPRGKGVTCKGPQQEKWECDRVVPETNCQQPLGMEDRRIPDSNIIASTYIYPTYKPRYARLNNEVSAWCAERNDVKKHIQIDLGKITIVTKIATQGSRISARLVTKYSLAYSNDRSNWTEYGKECGKTFPGNTEDDDVIVTNTLEVPITARYIRLIVKKSQVYSCLRMELYGCSAQ